MGSATRTDLDDLILIFGTDIYTELYHTALSEIKADYHVAATITDINGDLVIGVIIDSINDNFDIKFIYEVPDNIQDYDVYDISHKIFGNNNCNYRVLAIRLDRFLAANAYRDGVYELDSNPYFVVRYTYHDGNMDRQVIIQDPVRLMLNHLIPSA
jgi:hypothetical protein